MTDVAEVLATHSADWATGYCRCGWAFPAIDGADDAHHAHVAEQIQPLIDAEKQRAWDEGATLASPHGGGYLRSLLIENPYRPYASTASTEDRLRAALATEEPTP